MTLQRRSVRSRRTGSSSTGADVWRRAHQLSFTRPHHDAIVPRARLRRGVADARSDAEDQLHPTAAPSPSATRRVAAAPRAQTSRATVRQRPRNAGHSCLPTRRGAGARPRMSRTHVRIPQLLHFDARRERSQGGPDRAARAEPAAGSATKKRRKGTMGCAAGEAASSMSRRRGRRLRLRQAGGSRSARSRPKARARASRAAPDGDRAG